MTKTSLISDLTTAINNVTTNSGSLTDTEITAIYNSIIGVLNTTSPTKKPHIKQVNTVDIEFQ